MTLGHRPWLPFGSFMEYPLTAAIAVDLNMLCIYHAPTAFAHGYVDVADPDLPQINKLVMQYCSQCALESFLS